MMEGVSQEAASLAGHLKLDNLCWIYDNNRITIEGRHHARLQRRRGHALHRLRLERHARGRRQRPRGCSTGPSTRPRSTNDRPTLIIVDSHIGYGAPTKQDTHAAHGEPLGDEEIKLTKRFYGWPEDAKFLVPDGVRETLRRGHRRARGQAARASGWRSSRPTRRSIPTEADALYRMQHRQLPDGWDKDIPDLPRRRQGRGRARRLGRRC